MYRVVAPLLVVIHRVERLLGFCDGSRWEGEDVLSLGHLEALVRHWLRPFRKHGIVLRAGVSSNRRQLDSIGTFQKERGMMLATGSARIGS